MQSEKKIVKMLFRKKSATLVEYQKNGTPVRVSVPSNKVYPTTQNGEVEVTEATLREGIPYGVPWSIHLKDLVVKGEDIERELHKLGIWTLEDFRKNPGSLQNAILSVTAEVVRSIVQTVKEYSAKEVTK